MDISYVPRSSLDLYGGGNRPASNVRQQCLMARRFAEAGVRFIEINHGGWEQHSNLVAKHTSSATEVDKPIAGLITDLKQRNMLKDTLIVWGGEFGRTPAAQSNDGRN